MNISRFRPKWTEVGYQRATCVLKDVAKPQCEQVRGFEMTQQLPPIVSRSEWSAARAQLLLKEKAHTHAEDRLAAERRRLPMVEITTTYIFSDGNGQRSLLDLFEGRRQLILYHFMFAPGVGGWPTAGCDGCSWYADNVGNLDHLHARDTSFAMISRAPIANIQAYKERMGWQMPWVSSDGSSFNADFEITTDRGEDPGTSVFMRDGDRVFRTYFTSGRGDEKLGGLWGFLDITPFGRQETWEDSPAGWPQTEAHDWIRRHDEYGRPPLSEPCH
jgi:predicted dithiol-disulfide oxidoreductase (DUF899 family)